MAGAPEPELPAVPTGLLDLERELAYAGQDFNHPHNHAGVQHPNPAHYERQAMSPFPSSRGGGYAGILGQGIRPHPRLSGGGSVAASGTRG